MFAQLKEFIAIKTIAGHDKDNQKGVQFIDRFLKECHFSTIIKDSSSTRQPVLMAHHTNPNTDKKVVLYSHYDVEKIKEDEKWQTNPFELVEKEGRYWARGIADNKGVMLTRLLALKEMLGVGESLPNILWLFQGEEEVQGPMPYKVFPSWIKDFEAKLYLEETGVYDNNIPVIFHLPQKVNFLNELNQTIYNSKAIFENRSLRKFTQRCPFLTNIPQDGIYLGFGPNDKKCRIHRDNESLSIKNLNHHKEVFKKFLRWVLTAGV